MTDSLHDERIIPFAMIEKEVLRNPDIPPKLKALYGLLISYGPERIFPGQERLAAEMGVSRITINTWLKELRDEHKLIDWQRRGSTSNLYRILGPRCKASDTSNVKPALQHNVKPALQDRDPVYQESDRSAHPRSSDNGKGPDQHGVWTAHWVDESYPETECPACGESFVVAKQPNTKGTCPHCGVGLRVEDPHEIIIKKGKRTPLTLGHMFGDCPEAMCHIEVDPKLVDDLNRVHEIDARQLWDSVQWAAGKVATENMARQWMLHNAVKGALGKIEAGILAGTLSDPTASKLIEWGNESGKGKLIEW